MQQSNTLPWTNMTSVLSPNECAPTRPRILHPKKSMVTNDSVLLSSTPSSSPSLHSIVGAPSASSLREPLLLVNFVPAVPGKNSGCAAAAVGAVWALGSAVGGRIGVVAAPAVFGCCMSGAPLVLLAACWLGLCVLCRCSAV